jgi:alcohol dehydrogenase (NADP+)
VVGHEIVGIVEKLGSAVDTKDFKIGDRVGVGPQSDSCGLKTCVMCSSGRENYCDKQTGTYNSHFRDPDRSKAYGGYADRWRGPAKFAFAIPKNLSSSEAAPLLCGGVTVWSPLKKYGAGPGVSVGVIGMGGLGHIAILFAKALGCDKVIAISRTSSKKEDALNGLGADVFITTDNDPGSLSSIANMNKTNNKKQEKANAKNLWAKNNARSLDLIISTVSSPKMPLAQYLRLLKVDGVFVQVGAPEGPLPPILAWPLIQKGIKVTGSSIGSPNEIREMLEFAAKNAKGQTRAVPWVQERPMSDVNQALADMEKGRAKYRYVLVNDGRMANL